MRKDGCRRAGALDRVHAASATECTGLMSALPADEAEDRSEAALYDVLPEAGE